MPRCGKHYIAPDGPTSFSPLSITVPLDAVAGETSMRVSAKYNAYATPCETDFDGEVEDYGIVVIPVLGIEDNLSQLHPILTPNPTNGLLNIDMQTNMSELSVRVMDISGRVIQSDSYTDARKVQLTLSGAAGVYFVLIESDGKRVLKRIIKE